MDPRKPKAPAPVTEVSPALSAKQLKLKMLEATMRQLSREIAQETQARYSNLDPNKAHTLPGAASDGRDMVVHPEVTVSPPSQKGMGDVKGLTQERFIDNRSPNRAEVVAAGQALGGNFVDGVPLESQRKAAGVIREDPSVLDDLEEYLRFMSGDEKV